jgi:DNA repair protein RadC
MRFVLREPLKRGPVLDHWQIVLDYARAEAGHLRHERLHVLYLDIKNRLIGEHTSDGTIDEAPFYPREIIRQALELGAASLIMVHNHPSGELNPSRADLAVTRRLVALAEPLGIAIFDHLIVGVTGHLSLRSEGLLKGPV